MEIIQVNFKNKRIEKLSMAAKLFNTALLAVIAFYTIANFEVGVSVGERACSSLEPEMARVLYHNLSPLRQSGFKEACYKYTDNLSISRLEYDLYLNYLVADGYLASKKG